MEEVSVKFMVEDVVGCKWSLTVLDMIDQGINRPGKMTRDQEGLSTKVLNERLKKLMRYGVIDKTEFDEIPPRVEYNFTPFGKKFLKIIQEIRELESERTGK
jgi:DNA-binding HxlR family transcriptional regulator